MNSGEVPGCNPYPCQGLLIRLEDMSTNAAPPAPQWPLRPDARAPRRDWAAEFLALQRNPKAGKISGLSVAVAEWLQVDVLLVRTLFVVTALSAGVGLVAYLLGWLLTRDAQNTVAPLDKLSTRWRRLSPRLVISWALIIGALICLSIGNSLAAGWAPFTLLDAGWVPTIIITLTIWTGIQVRSRALVRGQVLPPAATAITPPPRSTAPLTILTLCVAVLAGGLVWDLLPGDIVLPLAAMLAVIGCGLVILAWRGRALALTIIGSVLALCLIVSLPLSQLERQVTLRYATQDDLVNTEFSDQEIQLDISQVEVTTPATWTVQLTGSTTEMHFGASQNLAVTVDYTDSMVEFPGDFRDGSGTTTFTQHVSEDQPVLTIHISAKDSQLWVSS